MGHRSLRRSRTLAATALLAACVVGSAARAEAETGDPDRSWGEIGSHIGSVVLDILIVRPLGAGATVGGAGLFLITAPLVAPAGNLDTTWDVFVYGPGEYTFIRRLGEF